MHLTTENTESTEDYSIKDLYAKTSDPLCQLTNVEVDQKADRETESLR